MEMYIKDMLIISLKYMEIQYCISGEVPFNCKMNSMDPISTDSFHELGLNMGKKY